MIRAVCELVGALLVPAPLRELEGRMRELDELRLPVRVAELERTMDDLEARMNEHDVGSRAS